MEAVGDKLTPAIVQSLFLEYQGEILDEMLAGRRCVTFIFMSTASLLRKINGQDVSMQVQHCALEDLEPGEIRDRCISDLDCVCVVVGTYLPFNAAGMGPDRMLVHARTCLKVMLRA